MKIASRGPGKPQSFYTKSFHSYLSLFRLQVLRPLLPNEVTEYTDIARCRVDDLELSAAAAATHSVHASATNTSRQSAAGADYDPYEVRLNEPTCGV